MLKQWRVTFQIQHLLTKEVLFTKSDTVAAVDGATASLITGLRVLEDGYTYKLLKIEEVSDAKPTNEHQHSANN